MRLDRLSMAHGILEGDLYWSYKGIENFSIADARRQNHTRKSQNTLVQTLLQSTRYIDARIESEIEHYMTECADEWREDCEQWAHRDACCPNASCPDEVERYRRRLEERFADSSERYEWAQKRVDSSWIYDDVTECAQDVFWVAYFLKDHPIEGVMTREGDYLDLDEIVGYCSCGEPLDKTCVETFEHGPDVQPHPFTTGPCDCDTSHLHLAVCGFDREALPRRLMSCPHCSEMFPLDDLEQSFVAKGGRPLTWPPGAPYPPRLSFDLRPMDAPPEEMETY